MAQDDALEAVGAGIFWRIHGGLPKQGPGSDASTRRALAALAPLPANPRVLDLGCGPGRQTLVLASETGGEVIAVDRLEPFLNEVSARAQAAGLSGRIEARQASMTEVGTQEAPFDLIWSEGAIYNIGFKRGLTLWSDWLKDGGAMAVTEAIWLRSDPSTDIADFWAESYPAMQTQSANEAVIAELGLELVDTFPLPREEWWTDYYSLIETRLETLRKERNDELWQTVVAQFDREVEVIRTGLDEFGYAFYVMRKAR